MVFNSVLFVFVSAVFYFFIVRPWHNRLGATDEEVTMSLPGDEFVQHPIQTSTRAITINAPPAAVYPWIVQMGQGKGGLYSYEWLENLVGCDMHNASTIVSEWQDTKAGDLLRLGPKGYPAYQITTLAPNHYMLTRGADPKTETVSDTIPETGMYANGTWLFFLKPLSNGQTRLIIRSRLEHDNGWLSTLLWRVTEMLHVVMEERMLRGIKERAENQRVFA